MAEVLLQDVVRREPSLQSAGIEVDSAGTSACISDAARDAIEVMREYGLNLTTHQSKPLDKRLIEWADLLLVMEAEHKCKVMTRFPEAASKTHMLSEYVGERGDILDPIDSGIEAYRSCAALLQLLLSRIPEKLHSYTVGSAILDQPGE